MALSPMMQHYLQKKEYYKDAILFYRLGDFYEMFFEDAIVVSKALDLTLTGKNCGLEEKAPMCGVPAKSAEIYIAKLIEKGFKVAVCEQLSEPKPGQIVERDVIRVITPGTIMESNMLDENRNNYIASIYKKANNIGLSWVDISTGEFSLTEFTGEDSINRLNDMLIMVKPSEIIVNNEMYLDAINVPSVKMNVVPKFYAYFDWAFEPSKATKKLKQQLKTTALSVFDCEDKKYGISAAGALVEYLNETQKRSLSHINSIKTVKSDIYMYLDINARRNLEITESMRDRKKTGSLLWVLDKTNTSMGARMMRSWVESPLQEEEIIGGRLDSVEELFDSLILSQNLSEELSRINDIERLAGRISYGNISPRDCVSLVSSLNKLPNIKGVLASVKTKMLKECNSNILNFAEIQGLLEKAIVDNPPMVLKDGGYIKPGYNAELDEQRDASVDGKNWLAKLEATEREETGIKNLKIGYNKVFGYYIEVTNSQKELVPFRYTRKQTLTNAERYITEDLKNLEEKILGAEDKALKLEQKLFEEIKLELMAIVPALQLSAKQIATIDVLNSLAVVALKNGYSKPKVSSKINQIKIADGRHPVVELLLKNEQFIPNDTMLDTNDNRTMIITGPNMAGKSTYMRQVAIVTLMAHIGSFVPAKMAEISLTDRIFTRVGASDDLAFGQSTFMVEMVEVANILHNATNNSLIILDEIGRGTSTFDGLSIAWSVMEYVSKNLKAKTLFSTHYHELTELEGSLEGVKNYRISIKELDNTVVFLRKIVRGGALKSFGIEVASLAGLPKNVITRSREILHNLEQSDLNKNSNFKNITNNNNKAEQKKDYSSVINKLQKLSINNLSPIECFSVLAGLIDEVKEK